MNRPRQLDGHGRRKRHAANREVWSELTNASVLLNRQRRTIAGRRGAGGAKRDACDLGVLGLGVPEKRDKREEERVDEVNRRLEQRFKDSKQ
jgi:hypothetical protein